SKGYARIVIDGEVKFIEEILNAEAEGKKKKVLKISGDIEVLIDRTTVNPGDEDTVFRLSDSVQTAFFEGEGDCLVHDDKGKILRFSDRFELDEIHFTEPSINFFSFNNPYGACQRSE